MCWQDGCEYKLGYDITGDFTTENAAEYFYNTGVRIDAVLENRMAIMDSIKAQLMLGKNVTVSNGYNGYKGVKEVKYYSEEGVFKYIFTDSLESEEPISNNFPSDSYEIIAHTFPLTAKECVIGNYISLLHRITDTEQVVDFIEKTSCKAFGFYFDGAINFGGIGIFNQPYIKAIVAKEKECGVMPVIYENFSVQEKLIACSEMAAQPDAGFNASACQSVPFGEFFEFLKEADYA